MKIKHTKIHLYDGFITQKQMYNNNHIYIMQRQITNMFTKGLQLNRYAKTTCIHLK